MKGVARDQDALAATGDVHHEVAGGVSRRRDQSEARHNDVGYVEDVGQPGIEDGLDRLPLHINLRLVKVLRMKPFVAVGGGPFDVGYRLLGVRRPMGEFPSGEEIARVRKGRSPPASSQAGVPSDVIDMHMGSEHIIDRIRVKSGSIEPVEVLGAGMCQVRGHGDVLVVADAGVDNDEGASVLDDERLDNSLQLPVFVHVVRPQPGQLPQSLRGGLWEVCGQQGADRLLHDRGDGGDGSRAQGNHANPAWRQLYRP